MRRSIGVILLLGHPARLRWLGGDGSSPPEGPGKSPHAGLVGAPGREPGLRYSMSDMRSAFATACVRVSASSFPIAFSMCVRTVSGEIARAAAI